LRYIVEQSLEGAFGRLDEASIRAAVFDQAKARNPGSTPLVRVEAHRLRWKLAEYYATEGRDDEIEISLVHRGYRAAFYDRRRAADPRVTGTSLLVLQFENLTGGTRAAHFQGGFMSELMYALTQFLDARIVTGNAWSAKRVRDALARSEIDAVIEGNIRCRVRDLRINAQLTRAADGTVLWSQVFEGSSADSAAQQQIACSVARTVGGILGIARAPIGGAGEVQNPSTPPMSSP
jgi:TolB-like protein